MATKWFLRHRYLIFSLFLLLIVIGVASLSIYLTGNHMLLEAELSTAVSAVIRAVIYISIFVMLQKRIPDAEGIPFYRHPLKVRFLLALLFFEVVIVHNVFMLVLENIL